jgi:GH25 family lysozyme M1 (1,4-beta-N-acetylmuramidase)
MAGKKGEKRTDDYGAQKDNQQNRDTVSSMVQKMLKPTGKNPYYKGEMAINNLDDLDDRLESFDTTEAPWVADWIEYLGDNMTAVRIRMRPFDFKKIIHERREELTKLS